MRKNDTRRLIDSATAEMTDALRLGDTARFLRAERVQHAAIQALHLSHKDKRRGIANCQSPGKRKPHHIKVAPRERFGSWGHLDGIYHRSESN